MRLDRAYEPDNYILNCKVYLYFIFLNKYVIKTLKNDCSNDLKIGKVQLKYMLAAISTYIFAPHLFPKKHEWSLCMHCMQTSIQVTAILSLISGNGFTDEIT